MAHLIAFALGWAMMDAFLERKYGTLALMAAANLAHLIGGYS